MMKVVVDTSFLIDLERSARNPKRRVAEDWLEAHADCELLIPAIVLGEFAEGFATGDDPLLKIVREAHRILPVDAKVALRYGALARQLRKEGAMIGANDTWIAATALVAQLPVLTRNKAHFQRVPELELVCYGSG